MSPASPGRKAASAPRAPPAAGRQITEAPGRPRGSVWGGGWREGASPTLAEKGSFFSCPCLLHPHRFLQASPLGTLLFTGAWRAGGPAQPSPRALRPSPPQAPRQGRSCARSRGAWLGSCPSGSARPELPPPGSPPGRARSPLPFSPLVSSFFCARRGEGRARGGRGASQPPPPGGGASEPARRRQPGLPFAPALAICPRSHRSCGRRPGCLGGRLRVTRTEERRGFKCH